MFEELVFSATQEGTDVRRFVLSSQRPLMTAVDLLTLLAAAGCVAALFVLFPPASVLAWSLGIAGTLERTAGSAKW